LIVTEFKAVIAIAVFASPNFSAGGLVTEVHSAVSADEASGH
jgi:hypothetical protein